MSTAISKLMWWRKPNHKDSESAHELLWRPESSLRSTESTEGIGDFQSSVPNDSYKSDDETIRPVPGDPSHPPPPYSQSSLNAYNSYGPSQYSNWLSNPDNPVSSTQLVSYNPSYMTPVAAHSTPDGWTGRLRSKLSNWWSHGGSMPPDQLTPLQKRRRRFKRNCTYIGITLLIVTCVGVPVGVDVGLRNRHRATSSALTGPNVSNAPPPPLSTASGSHAATGSLGAGTGTVGINTASPSTQTGHPGSSPGSTSNSQGGGKGNKGKGGKGGKGGHGRDYDSEVNPDLSEATSLYDGLNLD
ncbi:hypothetical protein BCR39DRAFT_532390 [Naematelia encephala]|uniref:Uncharacterized protein n=1 Tax=Naematelia encephala TaxID=71784 RepID=A0A1Y2B3M5_9TREE|nr:hypothetical protein BCR39DRAFT_532390 [Naematelia encephala]